jgi:hypothetical protein
VIDLLMNLRFFNRFDNDQLKMLLTKVTFKKVRTRSVQFFKENEGCIVVSGCLHLLTHEHDLASPMIAATYYPGDIIGIGIDNGWYQQKHSWLCAW